jgi:hypothetical protein
VTASAGAGAADAALPHDAGDEGLQASSAAPLDAATPDGDPAECRAELETVLRPRVERCKPQVWALTGGDRAFLSVAVSASDARAIVAAEVAGVTPAPEEPYPARLRDVSRCVAAAVAGAKLTCASAETVSVFIPAQPWWTVDLGPVKHASGIACGRRAATCGTGAMAARRNRKEIMSGNPASAPVPPSLAECPGATTIDCGRRSGGGPCWGALLPDASLAQRAAAHVGACCYELPVDCGRPTD